MDALSEFSSVISNKNSLRPGSFKPQRANAPKTSVSNNASKYSSGNKVDDTVSISQNAKNAVSKSNGRSSGSIDVNNHRVNYSITENNDLVIKIIDRTSNEVIMQIPQEEMLKVKEALAKVLEQKPDI